MIRATQTKPGRLVVTCRTDVKGFQALPRGTC